MFIIDEFAFLDHAGVPTGRTLEPQEGLLSHIQPSHLGYFFTDWGRWHICQYWRARLVGLRSVDPAATTDRMELARNNLLQQAAAQRYWNDRR